MADYRFFNKIGEECLKYEDLTIESIPKLNSIMDQLDQLSDGERSAIFHCYCCYCGGNDPHCQCANEE